MNSKLNQYLAAQSSVEKKEILQELEGMLQNEGMLSCDQCLDFYIKVAKSKDMDIIAFSLKIIEEVADRDIAINTSIWIRGIERLKKAGETEVSQMLTQKLEELLMKQGFSPDQWRAIEKDSMSSTIRPFVREQILASAHDLIIAKVVQTPTREAQI